MKLLKAPQKVKKNELINLGPQPVSHKFRTLGERQGKRVLLRLVQDVDSGTIQLAEAPTRESLAPDFDWLSNNEPEHHLDKLITKIIPLLSDFSRPTAVGISSKDVSTIDRLGSLGWDTWILDPEVDLGLANRQGVESIPSSLTRGRAKEIANRRGKADLLVARHIWEHTPDQSSFAKSLKELISRDGVILFEVPDCSPLLEANDYTMIWEEHLFYYTPETFLNSLAQADFSPIFTNVFPSTHEDVNVALVVNAKQCSTPYHVLNLKKQLALGQAYANNYPLTKRRVQDFLRQAKTHGEVGIFGAGHLTVAFVNYLGLTRSVDFITDDDTNKHGMLLPGTEIPIISRTELSQRNVGLLLLAVKPRDCETIIKRFQTTRKTQFKSFSIFPKSDQFLPLEPSEPTEC